MVLAVGCPIHPGIEPARWIDSILQRTFQQVILYIIAGDDIEKMLVPWWGYAFQTTRPTAFEKELACWRSGP
jgi:hypothetical protein